MPNILAPSLQKGDLIGYCSPSAPATVFAPKRYRRARAFLQNKGFELISGSRTGHSDFYRSGSIIERAQELNELIRNPKVKCIMSTIGGMNSNALLPYIVYSLNQDAAGGMSHGSKRAVGTWSQRAGLKVTNQIVWPGGTATPPRDPGCSLLAPVPIEADCDFD